MARISLIDIPNAPQGLAEPAMARVPNFGFDGRGAASGLMRDTLRSGDFDGPARGWQSLGDGVMNFSQGLASLGSGVADIAEARKKAEIADKEREERVQQKANGG